MKRLVLFALCLAFAFGFACAPAAAGISEDASAQPAGTAATTEPAPEPTPEPTAEPTPEPLGLAPADLFKEGYNLFFSETFPKGYTVYGARFDSADAAKGVADRYALYLTAEGDRSEITRYCAGLLGVTNETALTGYADSMANDGYAEIAGVYAGSPAYAWLKQTSAGYEFDQCTEVEGCRVELSVDVGAGQQLKRYQDLVLANYNAAMLGDFADWLGGDAIRRDMLCIFVNAQKPDKTEVYIASKVSDAAALEAEMAAALAPNWHDEGNHSMGITYGRIESGYRFDTENNIVLLTQNPNDNSAPAKDFALSDVSLTKLGFQFFPQDGLSIYEEKENNFELAIARPEWHRTAENWNLEYLDSMNGCNLGFWFYEEDGSFHISADKGGISAACDYSVADNTFNEGYPDSETQLSVFGSAIGSEEGDIRAEFFALLNKAVQQRFGMDWQTLYTLPVW